MEKHCRKHLVQTSLKVKPVLLLVLKILFESSPQFSHDDFFIGSCCSKQFSMNYRFCNFLQLPGIIKGYFIFQNYRQNSLFFLTPSTTEWMSRMTTTTIGTFGIILASFNIVPFRTTLYAYLQLYAGRTQMSITCMS